MLQCSVSEGDLHCQCILSIFPPSVHQFYANVLVFVNINHFLYINDQFALLQCSVPEGDLHCQCILSIFPPSVHHFYVNIIVSVNINPFSYINDQFALTNKSSKNQMYLLSLIILDYVPSLQQLNY